MQRLPEDSELSGFEALQGMWREGVALPVAPTADALARARRIAAILG